MSRVKTIVYKRIHNIGNYNNQQLEMTIELDESDDELEETAKLKRKVDLCLGLVPPLTNEEVDFIKIQDELRGVKKGEEQEVF